MATDVKDLIEAHEAMASVMDAKFPHLKEWAAFRAIDRALISAIKGNSAAPQPKPLSPRIIQRAPDSPTPYMTLAAQALTEAKKPVSTLAVLEYIKKRRPVVGDPKKWRIVVQSSLSKDERFKNVNWDGGRAWWWADKPLPPHMETVTG